MLGQTIKSEISKKRETQPIFFVIKVEQINIEHLARTSEFGATYILLETRYRRSTSTYTFPIYTDLIKHRLLQRRRAQINLEGRYGTSNNFRTMS